MVLLGTKGGQKEETMMGDLSEHFSRKEFECRHCHQFIKSCGLLRGLEKLRDLAQVPIFVLSGYRCAAHNRAVGGASNSQHIRGKAADIQISGLSVREMYDLAVQVPDFVRGGIGVYPEEGFIHVDARPLPARWVRIKGQYVNFKDWKGDRDGPQTPV